MNAGYPNLELVEYRFLRLVGEIFPDVRETLAFPTFEAECFPQTWPNTATGFDYPGVCAGSALTREYTTVMTMRGFETSPDGRWTNRSSDVAIKATFFGNEPAYVLMNPKGRFDEDVAGRNVASVSEAEERYGDEAERIWIRPSGRGTRRTGWKDV